MPVVRLIVAALILGLHVNASAQQVDRPIRLAVLDFGDSNIGRLTSEKLITNLKDETTLSLLDRDQVGTAARGAGYAGSLNLSINEARNLGAVLGCDYFILGDAQTLRRSPSSQSSYFDSYASMFLVSARTGRLLSWQRPNFQAATASEAEKLLLADLSKVATRERVLANLRRARNDEQNERSVSNYSQLPVIEAAPDDEKVAEAEGLRMPRPYRRLIPVYPETAARAEAEATVDVLVDVDSAGEIRQVELARWAGFGLDEATIETVRRLHFFPASRSGVAVPLRVLLRYNFRKPPK